jgi:hypothetical protein
MPRAHQGGEGTPETTSRIPLNVDSSAHDRFLQGLELQLTTLRQRHDDIHLLPPLIVLGAGGLLFTVGLVIVLVTPSCSNDLNAGESSCLVPDAKYVGALMGAVGLLLIPIGLTWWIVDLVIRGNLSGQIDDVNAQIARARATSSLSAPFHPWVSPWVRWGASGIALSVPF